MPLRYRPCPPLDRFVECFWYLDRPAAGYSRERALPTGTVELVFDLRENWSGICGSHSRHFVIDISGPDTVAGVHFRPGGAPALLGSPAAEFTDRILSLDDFWPRAEVDRLRCRLLEASAPEKIFAELECALTRRLRERLAPNPAVTYAVRELASAPAIARIASVREASGYSAKRLIDLFRGSVGLTPKVYCRIRRFQGAISRLSAGGPVDWCALALDCGFYDQSHLAREFRAFSGLAPSEYRPVDLACPNHVAI